ncbi:hypothetical protein V2G26_009141 [Clonostachys chloroleuca]
MLTTETISVDGREYHFCSISFSPNYQTKSISWLYPGLPIAIGPKLKVLLQRRANYLTSKILQESRSQGYVL